MTLGHNNENINLHGNQTKESPSLSSFTQTDETYCWAITAFSRQQFFEPLVHNICRQTDDDFCTGF